MLTKSEMEDAWNNKPVGFLKSYNDYYNKRANKLKNHKLYKVTWTPYVIQHIPSEELIVDQIIAKNSTAALKAAAVWNSTHKKAFQAFNVKVHKEYTEGRRDAYKGLGYDTKVEEVK